MQKLLVYGIVAGLGYGIAKLIEKFKENKESSEM